MSLTDRQVYLIAVNLEVATQALGHAARIAEHAQDRISTGLLSAIRDSTEKAMASYWREYERRREVG